MDYSLTLTVGRRLPGGVIHGLPSLLCSTSFAPSISLTHTLSCWRGQGERPACGVHHRLHPTVHVVHEEGDMQLVKRSGMLAGGERKGEN